MPIKRVYSRVSRTIVFNSSRCGLQEKTSLSTKAIRAIIQFTERKGVTLTRIHLALAVVPSAVVLSGMGSLQPARAEQPDRMEYLANNHIRLGIDLDLGGAITCLQRIGGPNMVNSHDWGRQIQMSDYSGPVPYEPLGKKPQPNWAGLGWNPIQSGDAFGNRSKVISFSKHGNHLTVTCIPMHWPLNDEPAHCTYTSSITLHGNAAVIHCTVSLHRKDITQYAARPQELPAVYTNGPWYRIFTYSGSQPFTGGALTREPSVFMWRSWMATEHWAALVNKQNRGLGIWEPTAVQFSGGFAGAPGSGGPHDNPTGYLAPNQMEILDHDIVFQYDYTLIVGSLKQIRSYVYSHTPSESKQPLPNYKFSKSRSNWFYGNASDTGWPISRQLKVLPKSDNPQIIGPLDLWHAQSSDVLIVRMAIKGGTGNARLFYRPFNQPNFDAEHSIQFAVKADGFYHSYRIPLTNAAGYTGAMIQLRLDPYVTHHETSWVKISQIKLTRK